MLKAQLIRKGLIKFEQSLENGGGFRKTLSKMYSMLLQNREAVDICRVRWDRELQREIVQEEWYSVHKYIRFISINIANREKN